MENVRSTPSKKKLTTADMANANAPMRDEDNPAMEGDGEIVAGRKEFRPESGADDRNAGAPREMGAGETDLSPLLSEDATREYRARWQNVQTQFVDEPRHAVEQADELVAEIMQQLAQSFSDQRSRLESAWGHSDQASTEDLRLALRRYRSFFDRLLAF
jgi:hypothetical protein